MGNDQLLFEFLRLRLGEHFKDFYGFASDVHVGVGLELLIDSHPQAFGLYRPGGIYIYPFV